MNTREDIIYGYVKKRNPFYPDDRKWRMTDIIDAMDYTWQHQQKKIDALKALNPGVPCPAIHQCKFGYDCSLCGTSGTVPLTKAQEYKLNHYYTSVIKELEAGIERLEELLQLHQENDKIAGAME